jgi:hypothetical protein
MRHNGDDQPNLGKNQTYEMDEVEVFRCGDVADDLGHPSGSGQEAKNA